jgi:hypothetical protein
MVCLFWSPSSSLIKDEVLLTVSCPIFPSILIAKNLLTGSLKKRSMKYLNKIVIVNEIGKYKLGKRGEEEGRPE